MKQLISTTFALLTLTLAVTPDGPSDQEVAKLVAELSGCLQTPSEENIKRQPEVEAKLAALGEQALPVLERELHLGIKFPELNEMQGAGRSRRWAAVTALVRIPGEKSTGLLYRSLFDPPDNFAMRLATLAALQDRDLSEEMLVGLLGHRETPVVLAAIEKAAQNAATPKIRAALEPLTRENVLEVQFENEYGASISSKESRWDVRRAAGVALGRDMTHDMRARANEILQSLKVAAEHFSDPDDRQSMGYMTPREGDVCRALDGLAGLGPSIADLIAKETPLEGPRHAAMLDMAKARLGYAESLQRVTAIMNEATDPSLRICAAVTLRQLQDPATKAALWKALKDPYRKESHECLDPGGSGKVYPVRVVAAAALIDLGEDPAQVRAALKHGAETSDVKEQTAEPTGKEGNKRTTQSGSPTVEQDYRKEHSHDQVNRI